MAAPQESSVIAGRYRLEALIGEGGMASVWRARDLTLQRAVAVKLLFARDDRDRQSLVDQFLREARIAAAVDHRNVIHIVDFGTIEGNQPFMVMELLEGNTLGQRLHRGPALTLSELVHVASLTLRGLAAVHEAGIIHRDLKPDNIFLKEEAGGLFPKILDFGISRSVEPASGRRSALTTREGIIVGTPEYMSPEQARGIKTVDHRTDLYSMGAILYEAMTGRLPFESENIGDLIIQIVTGTAPNVHDLNPAIPVAISEVVTKAMMRAPGDRFADASQMQLALLAAAEQSLGPVQRSLSDRPPPPPLRPSTGGSISQDRLRTLELPSGNDSASPIELAIAPTASMPARIASSKPPLGRPSAPRRWPWLAAALALVVFGAVALEGRRVDMETATETNLEVAPTTGAARLARAIEKVTTPVAKPALSVVRLRNVPADATITVDDRAAPGDTIELARDGAEHLIRVSAPNRTPWQVVHAATRDAAYDVWLTEAPPPAAEVAPERPAAPARRIRATRHSSPARTKKKPPSALRDLDF